MQQSTSSTTCIATGMQSLLAALCASAVLLWSHQGRAVAERHDGSTVSRMLQLRGEGGRYCEAEDVHCNDAQEVI